MPEQRKNPERIKPFNPLDKRNLGEGVAKALLMRPVVPLPPPPFIGAGIYAIYYVGDFPEYRDLAKRNKKGDLDWPIYVGKAVPPGARKGGFGLDSDPGQALSKRLAEHAESIRQVNNLSLEDFTCRYLVVDDIWIPLAESLLIERFSPVWNKRIDGFGNHDPGSGRHAQQRSQWDTIHPGRPWVTNLRDHSKTAGEIREQMASYMDGLGSLED